MTPSKRIAVAGGTGGIGTHVVEGLLEISQKYGLHIIVLSRTSKAAITYSTARAPVIGVDYSNPDDIEKVIREHEIDTVISTMVDINSSAFVTAQQNLLDGALRVPSVRRFAPSEFAVDSERLSSVKLYRAKLPILETLRKVKETRRDFEFTKFNCGIFMNYYGFGNPKPDGERAHGHLRRHPYIVNIAEGVADIPGDGNLKMSSTTAEDVGRFTAAATQLDVWPEESTMSGDVITINEVIELAERITGRKIEKKYNTEADVLARMDPNPESDLTNFYLEFFLAIIRKEIGPGSTLNASVSVKPTSVEDFLQKWWGEALSS